VIQQVENHLLLPNIIGRVIDLHPAAVIFAVLAGATFGGLFGVFLAAPVAASLRIVFRFVMQLLLDQTLPIEPSVSQQPVAPCLA
jgi:predicted PurR-regulated permease PerM